MGTLRELSSLEHNVHLLLTNSNLVEIYVYDELKKVCGAGLDSVITVDSVSAFKEMLELINIQPYLSEKWLVILDYSKLKAHVKKKTVIFQAQTACFLVKVQNYKDYKDFKELQNQVNDLYLTYIRGNEVMYLLTGFGLSQKMLDFVAKSYSRDPEKVFLLRKELQAGYEVKTQKDILKVCGTSSGSINYFAISLLKEFPTTLKGLKTVQRNRIKTAQELIDTYGASTFKNFLTTTVRDIIYIKELYISGVIYDSIRDLPECFDEKKLSKYSMLLKTIVNDIPYSRMVNLYVSLRESGYWSNSKDMLNFIYNYYSGVELKEEE